MMLCLCASARADIWCTAYYPGYEQSTLKASNVDFTALTHIIHFAMLPNNDGSLNTTANSISAANSSDVITRAHAAGKPVLLCIGGADTSFTNATVAAILPAFVSNIVFYVTNRGYDGVDIDWEPLPATTTERTQFTNLITSLRSNLNSFTPHKMLTAAIAGQYALINTLQTNFDQLNIMTYDLSGAYPGWVTWFNSPIYDGGFRFPSTGGLVPSTDGELGKYLSAGVASQRLGIGMAFYGYIWKGGTGTPTGGVTVPRESYSTDPTTSTPSFDTIMTSYYQSNLYTWDTAAQSAYLSIDNTGSTNDMFISYDDEHACQAKVSYARNKGIGGVMIWELGEGYRPSQPAGKRDPLLQAVKQARATPGVAGILLTNGQAGIQFASMPLGLYRVEWTTNLGGGVWNTLSNNVAGDGSMMTVMDTNAAMSNVTRFYRVKTPP
jgi:chitinase